MKNFIIPSIVLLYLFIGCNTSNNTQESIVSVKDLITKESIHETIFNTIQTDTFFQTDYEEKLAFLNSLFKFDFSSKNKSYKSYVEFNVKYSLKVLGTSDKDMENKMLSDSIKQLQIQNDIFKFCEKYNITYPELFREIKTIFKNKKSTDFDSLTYPIIFNLWKIEGISFDKELTKEEMESLDSLNKALDKELQNM